LYHHYTATLRNTSLHFTTLHQTTLHYTYRHFASFHLHFTTLSFGLTHLHFLLFYFPSPPITKLDTVRLSHPQTYLFTKIHWHRCRFYSVGDTLQILPMIVVLAGVVSAYPVEYEDLSHFGPAPVQFHQPAPLVKHLVVEKYVSLTCERFLLLGATKYTTLPDGKLNTRSQE